MSATGASELMGKIEQERYIGADYDADDCLIIIGNGFDLHHGLATRYSDYRDWLLGHDERVVADFESFDYAIECLDLDSIFAANPALWRRAIVDGVLLRSHSA